MDFDVRNDSAKIPYAYIRGNERVLMIKAGKGGHYSGYSDKYLAIASELNRLCGYTVICISNPMDECDGYTDSDILLEVTSHLGIESPELSLMGVSNGGIKVLQLGCEAEKVQRILLVNMPLMINFHKTKKYIESITERNMLLLYGERDPSFPYLPFIKNKQLSGVEIKTTPNADHNFTNMCDEFISEAVGYFSREL